MAMLEGSKLGFFKFDGIDKAIFRHQEIAARKDVDLITSMGHDFAIDRPEDSGAPIRSIGIGEADMSEDLEIFLDREVPAAVFPFDFFGFHFNFPGQCSGSHRGTRPGARAPRGPKGQRRDPQRQHS